MRRAIIKWMLYVLMTVLLFAFETSAGNRITICGVAADLIPFFVAAVAVMENYKGAAWLAFLAGVLCDVSLARENVFYCAVYFVLACICSIVSDYYLKRAYLASVLWGCIIFFVKALIRAMILSINVSGLGYFMMLKEEMISLLFSAALSWIVYVPVKYISRIAPAEQMHFDGVSLKKSYDGSEIRPKKRKYRIMKDSSMTRREEHFWSNIFK